MPKANLLDFDLDGLAAFCERLGEKRFRATQLFRWVHQRGASDFGQMTDLAKSLREKLTTTACVTPLTVISQHESSDGTIKWLFDVGDGNAVEAVFIPEDDRGTLCVSSQAGCAVGCRFCSTGHQGFSRNLGTGEIVAQLWHAEHFLRAHLKREQRVISNVVMMGMGEPLQNYAALVPALRVMLDDNAYGLSRRRVTVSTSGVVPMIDRLRRRLPGRAGRLAACADRFAARRPGAAQSQVPDRRTHRGLQALPGSRAARLHHLRILHAGRCQRPARACAAACRTGTHPRISCKFNLIPFNPFPASGLLRSPAPRVAAFARVLSEAGLVTTVRKTRGDDIDAACGQLAGDVKDRTRAAERMAQRRTIALHPVRQTADPTPTAQEH